MCVKKMTFSYGMCKYNIYLYVMQLIFLIWHKK